MGTFKATMLGARKEGNNLRFEVPMAMNVKLMVLWDGVPCSSGTSILWLLTPSP